MRTRCVIVFVAVTLIAAGHVAQAQDTRGPMVVAEGGAHSDPQAAQAPAADVEFLLMEPRPAPRVSAAQGRAVFSRNAMTVVNTEFSILTAMCGV